jgi:predicted  nucleic acid-binding Zn-ribbon protein
MMNDETDERRKVGALERHIQTVVQAGLLAVLLWIGGTVVDVRDRINRMEEKMVSLGMQVEEQKTTAARNMDDRWRGSDHKIYAGTVDKKFSDMEREHDKMDRRIETLERDCLRRTMQQRNQP